MEKTEYTDRPVLGHNVLVVRDRFTAMIGCYTTREGDADHVVVALKHLVGRRKSQDTRLPRGSDGRRSTGYGHSTTSLALGA